MTISALIIDSDAEFRAHAGKVLSSLAVTVTTAGSGADGVSTAEALSPSLILLCAELDDMSGYMVCKLLRENPMTKASKILLFSAKAKDSDFEKHKSLRIRADEYVHKPLSKQALIAIVRDLFASIAFEEGEGDITVEPDFEDLETDLNQLIKPGSDVDADPADRSSFANYSRAQIEEELENQSRELDYLRKETQAFKTFMRSHEDLKKAMAKSKSELLSREQEIARLEEELQTRKKADQEIADLHRQLEEARQDPERQRLQEGLAESEALAQAAGRELHQIREELETGKQELHSEKEKNSQQERLAENLKQQLQQALDKANEAHETLHEVQRAQADAERERQRLKAETLELETRLQQLQAEWENATEALADGEERNKMLSARLAEALDTAADQADQLRDKTLEAQSLTDNLELLKSGQAENEQQRGQDARRIKEHEAALAAKTVEFDELETLYKEAKAIADANTLRLKHQEEAHAEAIQELQTKFRTELDSNLDHFEAEKGRLKEENQRLRVEIEAQTQKNLELTSNFEQQVGHLEKQVAQLEQDQERAEKENLRQVKELEEERDTLKESLGEMQKIHTASQNELVDLKERMTRVFEEHDQALKKMEKTHLEALESERSLLTRAQSELEEYRGQARDMAAIEEKNRALGQEVDRLRLGSETLRQRLDKSRLVLEQGLREIQGTSEELQFEE